MDQSYPQSLVLTALTAIEAQNFDLLESLFSDDFKLIGVMFPVGKETAINILKSYIKQVVEGSFQPRDFIEEGDRIRFVLEVCVNQQGEPRKIELGCAFVVSGDKITVLTVRLWG